MCRATIYDARNNFSALVKLAESGEPVELTRHDKPVAVILSWEEYEKTSKKKSFVQKIAELREQYADVIQDKSFEGIPIPEDEIPDESYSKKLTEMWG